MRASRITPVLTPNLSASRRTSAGTVHSPAAHCIVAHTPGGPSAAGKRYPLWFADATYPCDVIRREHSPPVGAVA